jgi:undecaprenyl-diphosphatase
MNGRQVWKALRRRFSPEEFLGFRLALGLLLSLALLALFGVIAHQVVGTDRLTAFDTQLGLALRDWREADPGPRAVLLVITDLGSVPIMTGLALVVALVLLIRRRRLLPLVWLFALAGGGLLDAGLKLIFDRDRPWFRDPAIVETTKSFPSGHSMGSVVGYGMLAYLLMSVLPRGWPRGVAVGVLALLVLAIGFSRVYLGAHYFSDVIGGFAVGGCWLAACISAVEAVRRRRKLSSDR